MTPLRAKMIDEMKLRRFAPNTQEAYVSAVEGLAKFYNQSPDQINQERILKYLLYLMEDRKLAWNTCNIVVSGLRFFYTNVLGMDSKSLIIPARKREKRLPEILTSEELERLFNKAGTLKTRMLFLTTYSAGLRVSEVVRLKIKDIDSGRDNPDSTKQRQQGSLQHLILTPFRRTAPLLEDVPSQTVALSLLLGSSETLVH